MISSYRDLIVVNTVQALCSKGKKVICHLQTFLRLLAKKICYADQLITLKQKSGHSEHKSGHFRTRGHIRTSGHYTMKIGLLMKFFCL